MSGSTLPGTSVSPFLDMRTKKFAATFVPDIDSRNSKIKILKSFVIPSEAEGTYKAELLIIAP
jgi:uncharacterized FlgJ-related protein